MICSRFLNLYLIIIYVFKPEQAVFQITYLTIYTQIQYEIKLVSTANIYIIKAQQHRKKMNNITSFEKTKATKL